MRWRRNAQPSWRQHHWQVAQPLPRMAADHFLRRRFGGRMEFAMADTPNVQIPASLFKDIILFFEYVKLSHQEVPPIFNFESALSALREKQRRMNLRAAYSKSVRETDEEKKRAALAKYIMLKTNR
jgi:hypothetical protein